MRRKSFELEPLSAASMAEARSARVPAEGIGAESGAFTHPA